MANARHAPVDTRHPVLAQLQSICQQVTASDIGYCHLEKLRNLEALPPGGFAVSCFPVVFGP